LINSLQGIQLINLEHGIICAWCAKYLSELYGTHRSWYSMLKSLLYGTCCGTCLADDQGMIIVPSEHWVGEFGFNYHAIKIVSVKGLIKYLGVIYLFHSHVWSSAF
jgi:hypothetical protein